MMVPSRHKIEREEWQLNGVAQQVDQEPDQPSCVQDDEQPSKRPRIGSTSAPGRERGPWPATPRQAQATTAGSTANASAARSSASSAPSQFSHLRPGSSSPKPPVTANPGSATPKLSAAARGSMPKPPAPPRPGGATPKRKVLPGPDSDRMRPATPRPPPLAARQTSAPNESLRTGFAPNRLAAAQSAAESKPAGVPRPRSTMKPPAPPGVSTEKQPVAPRPASAPAKASVSRSDSTKQMESPRRGSAANPPVPKSGSVAQPGNAHPRNQGVRPASTLARRTEVSSKECSMTAGLGPGELITSLLR